MKRVLSDIRTTALNLTESNRMNKRVIDDPLTLSNPSTIR
jgi:hypothetical protein